MRIDLDNIFYLLHQHIQFTIGIQIELGDVCALLLHAPYIPAGMTRFLWNPQESTGTRLESTGIRQESTGITVFLQE